MTGLLLKDICTLKKQLRLYFLICLIIAVTAGWNADASGFISVYIPVFISVLPGTALSYDEQSKWNQLAAMMPYTTFQLVFSKYVLGYFFLLIACVITTVSQGVVALLTGGSIEFGIGVTLLAALILVAVSLPLLFRFSVEKGRLAFLLLTVIVAVGIQMTADQTVWILDRFGFYGALVVLAVLLNVGSVLLSCRFYRRRVW